MVYNSDHTTAVSLHQEKHSVAEARISDLSFLEAADHRAALLADKQQRVNQVPQFKEERFSLFRRGVSIVGLQHTLQGTIHRSTIQIEVPLVLYVASVVHVFQGAEVDQDVC